jgi:hypothetical protein
MYEGITPAENREFTSSLGNWTGDGAWDPGPIGARSGLLKMTSPGYASHAFQRLAFPYAKPSNGKQNTFLLYFYALGYPLSNPYIVLSFTDGIYTFSRLPFYDVFTDRWIAVSLSEIIPSDWISTGTILTIEMYSGAVSNPATIYADDASLYAETARKDHLPLMGVH